MPFRISKPSSLASESPEALFRDLRARKIQGLLSHQADILREYVETARDKPDVAFQLPTGSGKTLVGLLLGEWRRRNFRERVVYLCLTNQLVHQVADQANLKYGIRVHAFTGSKTEYDPSAKNDYLNADSIAVTSYSALFNIRPFFEHPNLIILDDAHAAESYIASHWSLKIERFNKDHKDLFTTLAHLLRSFIPGTDFQKLTGENDSLWDKGWVDKLPTPVFHSLIPEVTSILDEHAQNSDLLYPWRLLRDHLYACHLYYSTREILIRPLLPPTSTHSPFTSATQRVYMSATLGEGGDLERITGRANIYRLRVPPGWDKQGIGRRLFIFPERSLEDNEIDSLILAMINTTGRALVLVPDDKSAQQFKDLVTTRLNFPTFNAREIERSKEPFVSSKQAVAVIANRYDGIDFPDDECRLLIVHGLPRATNLQERFIITKMGAIALLRDRILTRIIQAFGRCTRSSTDYAAIIVRGEELNTFLMKREHRGFLHPELQAELEFGIDQSRHCSFEDFLANLNLFLSQDKEWVEADEYIVSLRQTFSQKELPGTEDLRKTVSDEIGYQNAIWRGNYLIALEHARKVLSELKHSDLAGYRAIWYYLAGCAAWLADNEGMSNLGATARDYFKKASEAATSVRWLVRLTQTQQSEQSRPSIDNSQTMVLIERLEVMLEQLGVLHDQRYAREEKEIIEGLSARDSRRFEQAQVRLGRLLGFESGKKESTGSPDPWWIVNEDLCIVFEDHSEADVNSRLHVDKARQAATHPNWIRENLTLPPGAVVMTVLVTPVKSADPDALPHLKNVYLWPIEDFKRWALNALSVIRELRRTFPGSGDPGWRASAIEKYDQARISPHLLTQDLSARRASDLLKP